MKKKVTVGVAAVAGRYRADRRPNVGVATEAVLLVTDRRLTSGDNSVYESWVPKIRGMIGTGRTARTTWSALFAGDDSLIDDIKADLVSDKQIEALHDDPQPNLNEVADAVSAAAATAWNRLFDAYVYRPFGLTREDVRQGSKRLAKPLLDRVIAKGLWFDSDDNPEGCELALCGFDERGRSAVLSLNVKGDVTRHFDIGCVAIGEGAGTAQAALELLGYQPWMDLGSVIYMAIDAKLSAERVASVGPTTDAWVLLRHEDQPIEIPQALIEQLTSVRAWHATLSPFSARDRQSEPDGWRNDLWAFVKKCYEKSAEATSSIEREPPSWL